MSKCTNCGGTGTVACPSCQGQGYTSRLNDDGEMTRRLCGACEGKRHVRCGTCRGTGEVVVPAPAALPPTQPRPQAQVDRLAGRWKGIQGTWYEFVPDGNGYRATAGGPAGVSAVGTARLVGHTVTLDATDNLLGHYTLELALR